MCVCGWRVSVVGAKRREGPPRRATHRTHAAAAAAETSAAATAADSRPGAFSQFDVVRPCASSEFAIVVARARFRSSSRISFRDYYYRRCYYNYFLFIFFSDLKTIFYTYRYIAVFCRNVCSEFFFFFENYFVVPKCDMLVTVITATGD